ncbi:MAG: tetratricopeptide repeat protein, partial [Zoogloea sp.]|nr:tetratricopeptide repeat protein [Zoogloea sp.]
AGRPASERLAGLAPLLDDPLRAVRISAARGLADLPDDALAPDSRPLRRQGLADFIAAQQAMADMPAAQVNLALLHAETGDAARAHTHFRRAVAQDPVSNAYRLALARFLVAGRQPAEARQVLKDGIAASAQPGELHLALGLLAGEQREWDEALAELRRATELMPANPQARRNLDALQRRLGQPAR